MARWPRNLLLPTVAAMLLATLASGCNNDDDDVVLLATIQFLHASPDSLGFDIYDQLNTTDRALIFSDLMRDNTTGFLSVNAGSHKFTLSPVGSATELLEILPSLTADRTHTVVIYDLNASLRSIFALDPSSDLGTNIRFRAFHAAPNVGVVTILIDLTTGSSGPLFSDLAVGEVSTDQELPPSAYRIYLDLNADGIGDVNDPTYDLPALLEGEFAELIIADALLLDPYILFLKSDGTVTRVNRTP